jgi:hypothetical protein
MNALTLAPSVVVVEDPGTAEQSSAVAHAMRDHVTVLANALEVIRLGHDPAPALRMAARQLDALARLADALHDPTRGD